MRLLPLPIVDPFSTMSNERIAECPEMMHAADMKKVVTLIRANSEVGMLMEMLKSKDSIYHLL